MSADPTLATRPSLRLRADVPDDPSTWGSRWTRPATLALGVVFVLLGAANLELGPIEARLGLASSEPMGPFGRVFGYWDPSLWPVSVALGQVWGYFEEEGATQNAVRWPSAIAGLLIGLILARRARLTTGPRSGLLVALAWFGSLAMMDRSGSTGLDVLGGLGTIAALDRLLAQGSGWAVGAWASLAFLAGGWPPVALLALSTVVIGRSKASWSWSTSLPVLATFAGWSGWCLWVAPAEAWATALAMPITQSSSWGLAFTAFGLGLPWSPFVALAAIPAVRQRWSVPGRSMLVGWLQVLGACLVVGTIVPGLGSAALMPALAGLAMVSAGGLDRAWADFEELPEAVTRRVARISMGIAGLWLLVVLGWGGYVGFAVAYYRATLIGVAAISLAGFSLAVWSSRSNDPRWALGALVAVCFAVKLACTGYYIPEMNYRYGAGPWGRAIGQWVPEKHPIYVLHPWPADLAFATGRPFRQLATPQHIEFQPGAGSKFVLLEDSEYAEYQGWARGWPKLIKVAEFEDEMGLGKRILTRTDAPLIVERPYRKHDPVE